MIVSPTKLRLITLIPQIHYRHFCYQWFHTKYKTHHASNDVRKFFSEQKTPTPHETHSFNDGAQHFSMTEPNTFQNPVFPLSDASSFNAATGVKWMDDVPNSSPLLGIITLSLKLCVSVPEENLIILINGSILEGGSWVLSRTFWRVLGKGISWVLSAGDVWLSDKCPAEDNLVMYWLGCRVPWHRIPMYKRFRSMSRVKLGIKCFMHYFEPFCMDIFLNKISISLCKINFFAIAVEYTLEKKT